MACALCSARFHERTVFAAAGRNRALPAVARRPRAERRKRLQVGARAPHGERQVLGARRAARRRRPQPLAPRAPHPPTRARLLTTSTAINLSAAFSSLLATHSPPFLLLLYYSLFLKHPNA